MTGVSGRRPSEPTRNLRELFEGVPHTAAPLPGLATAAAEPSTLVVVGSGPWDAVGDLDVKRLLLLAARRGWAGLYFAPTLGTVEVTTAPNPPVGDADLFSRIAGAWAAAHSVRWQALSLGTAPPDLMVAGVRRSRPGSIIEFLQARVPRAVALADGDGPWHHRSCLENGCLWDAGQLTAVLQASPHRDVPLSVPDGLDRTGRPVVPVLVDNTAEDHALVKALAAVGGVYWRVLGGRYASLPPAPLLLGELPTWRAVVVPPYRGALDHPWVQWWQQDLADWGIPVIGQVDGRASAVRTLPAESPRDVARAVASVTLRPLRAPPDEPTPITAAWAQMASRGGKACRST